jgi:ribonucleotide reductase alpha subunit
MHALRNNVTDNMVAGHKMKVHKTIVIKRTGTRETFLPGKLSRSLSSLAYDLDSKVGKCCISVEINLFTYFSPTSLSPFQLLTDGAVLDQIAQGVSSNITTASLSTLAAETIASFATHNVDYAILAGRVEVSNLHKRTEQKFSRVMSSLRNRKGSCSINISDELHDIVCTHRDTLDNAILDRLDYNFDYFGIKTLMKSYLLRRGDGTIGERPQHMFMRVALGIHGNDIERALDTYRYLSQGFFIHATPTLFNAGTKHQQMSSCFLTCMKSDSIDGIYDTLKDCAVISKFGGGIGLSVSDIPSSNEFDGGIVPMLRVFNNSARYVVQSGGRRKGNIAVYIEPWHPEIFAFLDLKKNNGNEMERARDLFYSLWIPDLFMKRVKADESWTLFCPSECQDLETSWGDTFDALYEQYEREGKGQKIVNSRRLWYAILESQVETGTPYMLYKDHCNRKSNQRNLGTIRSSNLCAEVVQFTAPNEIAVCNLASLSLPKFIEQHKAGGAVYNFDLLRKTTKVVLRNLDRLIDRNFYPLEAAKRSNLRHRPVGIGVQGLADVFQMMRFPFDSREARQM